MKEQNKTHLKSMPLTISKSGKTNKEIKESSKTSRYASCPNDVSQHYQNKTKLKNIRLKALE